MMTTPQFEDATKSSRMRLKRDYLAKKYFIARNEELVWAFALCVAIGAVIGIGLVVAVGSIITP